ncbi:MAG: hypothetical protein AAF340_18015 [Pseudomonadota bacterium]
MSWSLTDEREQRRWFLFEACTELGFCIPPKVQDELILRDSISRKELVRAVIEAEGIFPVHLESYEHFDALMEICEKFVDAP